LYDEEDAVYRCEDCMHEIWNGICTACGRIYARFQEPVDLVDVDDEDEDLGQPGFHFPLGGPGFMQAALMNQAMHLGMMFQPPPLGYVGDDPGDHPTIVEEAGEDDEEDGYESSFIDDEGPDVVGPENDTIATSSPPPARGTRTRNPRHHAVVISSDEEDSDISTGADQRASTASITQLSSRRNGTARRPRSSFDEGTTRSNDQIRWDSDEEGSHSTSRFVSPVSDHDDEW